MTARPAPLSPEQVRAVFEAHRTVRHYASEAMPPEHLDTILYAAQRAPTDATAQMYSLIRLTDPGLRAQLAERTANPHFGSAAEAFVVCLDVHRLRLLLERRGYVYGDWPAVAVHFGIGDAVLAGQSLLLAAELLGYQGCWIGGVLSALPEVLDLLALPPGVLPFAGLTIGRPAESPAQRPRLARTLVVHENSYREPSAAELDAALTDMAPITARGDWAQSLARYFAVGGSMEDREPRLRAALRRQGFGHVAVGAGAQRPANSPADLDELTRQAGALGYPAWQLRRAGAGFEVWLDNVVSAVRGEGPTPTAALLAAVSAARAEVG